MRASLTSAQRIECLEEAKWENGFFRYGTNPFSRYKVRVSISCFDYERDSVRTGVISLLQSFSKEGKIHGFKYINLADVRIAIKKIKQAIRYFRYIKELLGSDPQNNSKYYQVLETIAEIQADLTWYKYQDGIATLREQNKLPPNFNKGPINSWDEVHIAVILDELEKDLNSNLRFLFGGQFTIYIVHSRQTKNYLSELMMAMNDYLQKNNAHPGLPPVGDCCMTVGRQSFFSIRGQVNAHKQYVDSFGRCPSLGANP